MNTAINELFCTCEEQSLEILEDIIYKSVGDRDGRKINRVEDGLVRFLSRHWNTLATTAISKGLSHIDQRSSELVTQEEVEKVIAEIDDSFVDIHTKTEPRIQRDIQQVYQLNLSSFRRKFPSVKIARKQEDDLVLTSTDREIISNLVRLKILAVGDHYPKSLKPEVVKLIREGVLVQGLNKREAGKFLMESLSQKLGGYTQAVPAAVKRGGQEAATRYFTGLSATTVTRARNFGNLNFLSQAGITQYRWAAIVDKRTSHICLDMNGRLFTVDQGREQMEAILTQETSDGLINAFPWRRNLSEFGIARNQRLSSQEVASQLASAGVPIVPPAHFRCRSEIIPA